MGKMVEEEILMIDLIGIIIIKVLIEIGTIRDLIEIETIKVLIVIGIIIIMKDITEITEITIIKDSVETEIIIKDLTEIVAIMMALIEVTGGEAEEEEVDEEAGVVDFLETTMTEMMEEDSIEIMKITINKFKILIME
jgi:hypothetical protein